MLHFRAIALAGHFDNHVDPFWDGGHIKFWSFATLSKLLLNDGFASVEFHRAGRVPSFAKSMIAVARKGP
jgi:2-polyprenyl-6-hydroxyphenyl methylase/3-demethylubiquinone-9 3-methyltransferase